MRLVLRKQHARGRDSLGKAGAALASRYERVKRGEW
jgi:hypothetical protein